MNDSLELTLQRVNFQKDRTLGNLFANDKFFCYTLEDVVRAKGEKIYGQTAIPYGTYNVILTKSKHFHGKLLPLILRVPNFLGCRLHGGNDPKDTLGCVLVCHHTDGHKIWKSASDDLVKLIQAHGGKATLTIIDMGETKDHV